MVPSKPSSFPPNPSTEEPGSLYTEQSSPSTECMISPVVSRTRDIVDATNTPNLGSNLFRSDLFDLVADCGSLLLCFFDGSVNTRLLSAAPMMPLEIPVSLC